MRLGNSIANRLTAIGGGAVWGAITGLLSDQTDLQDALDSKLSGDSGSVTVDFGAFPGSNEANIEVTGQAGILSTDKPQASIAAVNSGAHSAGDATYAASLIGVTCSAPTNGVGFTVFARSWQKLEGTYQINWNWSR